MKLAVTVWNHRIAPVFDSAGSLLVTEIQGGRCQHRYFVNLAGKDLDERAQLLVEHQIDELICGAISREAEELVRDSGVKVFPFVAGEVEQLVQTCTRDGPYQAEYSMPGCARWRKRRRGRGGGKFLI